MKVEGPVLSSVTNSDFLEPETGMALALDPLIPPDPRPASADAGIEKPTTLDVGRVFLAPEGAPVVADEGESAGFKSAAHDFFTGAGTGVDEETAGVVTGVESDDEAIVEVGAKSAFVGAGESVDGAGSGEVTLVGVGAVNSETSGADVVVASSFAEVAIGVSATATDADRDVLDDAGDAGRVAVGVPAVALDDEDGIPDPVGRPASADFGSGGGIAFEAIGFGEGGGVRCVEARSTTCGGGRARGEMMMPGACLGSRGILDQIARLIEGCEVDASLAISTEEVVSMVPM